MGVGLAWVALLGILAADEGRPVAVRIGLNGASEVDVAEVVGRLAEASAVAVARPPAPLSLPTVGLAGPMTRTMLGDTLGPDASLGFGPRELVVTLAPHVFEPGRKPDWERRLRDLAERAGREVARRSRYGMHARPSYRPNDPARPTVCLIHGLNSTSGVFKHMVGPIEAAGYGVVAYDFPYNRDLDETSPAFGRDWAEFRRASGDARPWAIVAHSMGSLLARTYVEDDAAYGRDVSSLILIAPPNRGSSLAKAQTLVQMIQGAQALNGSRRTDPLAILGDGLGAAADDMTPGSAYLRALNARGRRAGVRYRTIAGDVGYLNAEARRRFEGQVGGAGMLGGIGRIVAAGASAPLDEITDGLGDGCVAVASTRLEGVAEHRVLHANHLELIRAPLAFPEPGPVASMPEILRWLGEGKSAGGKD